MKNKFYKGQKVYFINTEGREDLPEHIRQLSEWEDEEYKVYEKVDGSLIIMFMYEGEGLT